MYTHVSGSWGNASDHHRHSDLSLYSCGGTKIVETQNVGTFSIDKMKCYIGGWWFLHVLSNIRRSSMSVLWHTNFKSFIF